MKKGQAIIWYNHAISGRGLGGMDEMSIHGGCRLHLPPNAKGKWVANHWVEASEDPAKDLGLFHASVGRMASQK